jgi:DNA topoisomerase-1
MINIRVGRYGPYLERGDERATIPEALAPDELDIPMAEDLLEKGSEPIELGVDTETGNKVYSKTGRYGPYVQLGENDEEPKMKSLLPGMEMDTVTLEDALRLVRLPRLVGTDSGNEEEPVLADYGRYGPYLKRGTDTRSLEKVEDIFEITLEQALAKLAEPPARGGRRRASKVIKELGVDPSTEAQVRVLAGPYGPYVSDGSTNASIPKGDDPEAVSLGQAIDLIRVREASGKGKKRARKKTKKKKARKKATKKKVKKKAKKKA